jgi:hypothetical protein
MFQMQRHCLFMFTAFASFLSGMETGAFMFFFTSLIAYGKNF